MTVKGYITSKFKTFGIKLSEADLFDISISVDIEGEMSEQNRNAVYVSLALTVIPQWLLRAKTVSENGFSISWDNDALLRYYSWLCKTVGIENKLNGESSIEDGSCMW
jgi:hypothetical protein